MNQERTAEELEGKTVVATDGAKIGTLKAVYVDPDTQAVQWGLVHTGLFGMKTAFVPLVDITSDGGNVVVPYAKDQISDAPHVDVDAADDISQEDEAGLASYYGLGYSRDASSTGLVEPRTGAPQQAPARGGSPDAMTRSEERAHVETISRPRETVRLRKTIVSEPVSATVPVRRDELRVEREPITDANVNDAMGGPDLRESEHEVTLMEEEPVLKKTVEPVERVRMSADKQVEERTVQGEVRKERVDVERGRQN